MGWLFGWMIADAVARSGGITGQSVVGCSCHAASADATTTAAFVTDADLVVAPGASLDLVFRVSTTTTDRVSAGLNVSATGGTLEAGANTRVSGGEITHSGPVTMTDSVADLLFAWRAPNAEGTYTLRGAGNAVNLRNGNAGDGWNRASDLVITVDDGCNDADGDGANDCGEDCDDQNPDVRPGVADAPYDGVDADCAGDSDFDADGDGVERDADCDDTDPARTTDCGDEPEPTDDAEPTDEAPATDEPTTDDPATDEPATDEPAPTDDDSPGDKAGCGCDAGGAGGAWIASVAAFLAGRRRTRR